MTETYAAGWYPDPDGTPGDLRYYDGQQWTEHRQPAQPASAPTTSPGAPSSPPGAPTPTLAAAQYAPPTTTPTPAAYVPPSGGAGRSRTGLVIAVVAVAVLLLAATAGGVALWLGRSDSSESLTPEEWANSFCTDVGPEALTLQEEIESISGDDVEDVVAVLEPTVAFLDASADSVEDLGAPDTTGGETMAEELPPALRRAAGDMSDAIDEMQSGDIESALASLQSIDPTDGLSDEANEAWAAVEDAMSTAPECSTVTEAFE